METADKKEEGKPAVELVNPQFIMDVGTVLAFGAKKYAPNNWRKGLPWTKTLGATMRHLLFWSMGEDTDKESGLPHLSHAATNIMFLMEWKNTHPDMDDRFNAKK